MGIVVFNDISSEDLGLIVQTPPTYDFPEKDVELTHVPGKDGDVVIDSGSYKNVNRTYNIASILNRPGDNFSVKAREITAWLNSAKGYARLEDTYEPDFYRMAVYRKQNQMIDYYGQATTLNVEFECKPQRYYKEGDKFISVTAGTYLILENPFIYTSKPVINISCSANTKIHFYVGDNYDALTEQYTVTITEAVTNLTIDCELQDCYDSSSYKNSIVTLSNSFPQLAKGKTWIYIEGTITTAQIKPRWWAL